MSGTGGQFDFQMGAVMSKGGRGITLLRSTALGGISSRIVPQHEEGTIISVPRTFADTIITEYGVAQLLRQVQQRTRPRAHQHRPPQLPPRPNQSRRKALLPITPIIPPPEAGTHPRRRAAPSPVGATGRSPWGGALPLVPSVIPALLLRHSCAEAGIHPRRRGRGGVASYPLSLSP